ncbi:hypothetical protein BFW38_14555 [Terasakiispira papahanaumokuakeensis]|uniref:Thiol:disulfide interchange protein n=1 Tax=Terasakiispira papahanaumokuakeensis TaxID=197479 RepID=A0A1E2VC30_9GAMM|nr:thiol:disulfide interchange protein DsbG [Terasakiispira papahanaumokuakeensis]ODC04570.1 hypothetical protein BFW38_14555 [Terasakiispira papahanaumokuakeensis]
MRNLIHSAMAMVFCSLFLVQPASAAEPTSSIASPPADYPEPIQHLINQGLEVIRQFDVNDSLDGWVVSNKNEQEIIVYTTADGENLISGVVMDAQGQDLTQQHQREYLSKPSWEDLAASHYITSEPKALDEGDKIPESDQMIYVFFDPNCPYCHMAWKALQPYRAAGLTIRWIPVAYLKPDSRNKAAALLDSDQPDALLSLNMTQFGTLPKALDGTMTDSSRDQLQDNMSLMQGLEINGTPGIVWQDRKGHLQVSTGMPRLEQFAQITGLPEQPQSDPDLARFR